MRTKNAKRLWPVPATLAVVALAAFVAFGLLATTGVQPVEAQDEPCVTVDQVGDRDPSNGECSVTSSMAVIKLTNNSETMKHTFHVFAENLGDDDPVVYPPGTVYDDTTDQFEDSDDNEVQPLRYMVVEVGEKTFAGDGSATVTITGDPLSTAKVYVFATGGVPGQDPISGAPTGASIKNDLGLAGAELTVSFLGKPVATAPDDKGRSSDDDNENPELRSNLQVTAHGASLSAAHAIGTTTSTDGITVTAKVKDENDVNLKGKITYTVEFMEGSAVASGFQMSHTTPPMDFDADFMDDGSPAPKGNTYVVRGWAAEGPVSINVSAIFIGDTGSIELPLVSVNMDQDATDSDRDKMTEASLTRAGPLDDIMVVGTCYAPSADAEEKAATKAQIKVCGMGADPDDATGQVMVGMRQRTVFAAGQMFTVRADAIDALDTPTGTQLTISLPDVETEDGLDALSVTSASFTGDPGGDDTLVVSIHEDAPPQMYTLTVKARQGSGNNRINKEATIEIIVSGEVYEYEIIGPENIALASFSSAEYTVKATDMQGNPPNFKEGEDMVLVVIESDHSLRVTGLEENMAMLDHETGTDTFTVYKPAGAMDGDIASIGIFVDDELQDSIMVSFGEALPEMMAPGMPMNVMADATSHDMITVTWESPDDDGGSPITGYMVQRKPSDDCVADLTDPGCDATMFVPVDPAHMGMDMMYMDMGLMAETTYYYRVAAMNAEGMGDYSDGMAMAMTMAEAAAPAMLTAPADVTAMSDAAGMVTVSWTPGEGAVGGHLVLLFTSDFTDVPGIETPPDGTNTENFTGIAAGDYVAVVVSIKSRSEYLYDYATVTVN